ncbi:Golgi apparatus membrane protein TVP38 [Candida viswanathii]|uniref:Golgi apparatus membrane protein TVP38 n=1 Tax=Candida viswanathii TaxID=5486 RepID=A0A367XWE1_9ASCO|nr:Golgi apparatus membrane protein TVP38 [Candida viswanathii]
MPQLPSTDNNYGYRYRTNSPPPNSIRGMISSKISQARYLAQNAIDWYFQQSTTKKILIAILLVILAILGILLFIFHIYIIKFLIYLSEQWHGLKYGTLLIFFLVFIVGFPPMIGFTGLSLLTGMIYGFPNGWPLLAGASIAGCTCSFLVFRYVLQNQAQKLMNHNETFRAFAEILRDDNSLLLLILIRLCPLPYSLSNGALAAIPELPLSTYFLATLITSPKLLIHLFVGSKLKAIGDEKSTGSTRLVDIASILITATAASLAAYLIYAKMQQKLASYHSRGLAADDALVFGNFEDDLEMGSHNEIELNSADFDADNFIIEDEDEEEEREQRQEEENDEPTKDNDVRVSETEASNELTIQGSSSTDSNNRDI